MLKLPILLTAIASVSIVILLKFGGSLALISGQESDKPNIEVVRPPLFFVEGTEYTIPIIVTNNSNETRDFVVYVRSYPFELRDSSTYSKALTYNSRDLNKDQPVGQNDSFTINHKFKPTWDGRWQFNVTAIGLILNGTASPVIWKDTGDIKVQSLAIQEAINAANAATTAANAAVEANDINRTIASATIIAAILGPAAAASGIALTVREMRRQNNYLTRSAKLKILYKPKGDPNPDLYEPANTVILVQDPAECGIVVDEGRGARRVERKFLRVAVQNNGTKVAKGCTADIELIAMDSGCKVNSFEPKPLRWDTAIGDPYAIKADIAPYGGRQVLNVFFADECPHVELAGLPCGEDSTDHHLRAYVSTPRAFKEPWDRNQDGLCRGKFRFRLNVYSEESEPTTEVLGVTVTKVWNELSMQIAEKPIEKSR